MSTEAKDLAAKWWGTRIGHEAAMLDSLMREKRLTERLVRKLQNGTIGQATEEPEDREMGVHVGDVIVQNPPAASSSMSTLAKLGLAAALLASGAGIGSAIPLAISALSEQAPPAAEAPADQDTLFDLELVP